MKDPLGVSPSKGNQRTTRGKEKILLTSVGIEPTTSGLDLPLLCQLSDEVGQRKLGTIMMMNRGKEKVTCLRPKSTLAVCDQNGSGIIPGSRIFSKHFTVKCHEALQLHHLASLNNNLE